MTVNDQNIAEKLQALRAGFARHLPERINKLLLLWDKARQPRWNWSQIEDLHRQLHTLTGSAPTFGYLELGTRARQAETLLKSWISAQLEADAARQQELTGRLQQLQTCLADLSAAPGGAGSIATLTLPDSSDVPVYLLSNDRQAAEELRQQLQQFNFQVSTYNTTAALEDAVRAAPPAALILDDASSDQPLDTTAIALSYKQRYGADLPVILMATGNDFQARMESVRAGCNAHLVKPVDFTHLVDQLDYVIQPASVEPYRVLIVDDDIDIARHFQLALQTAGMNAVILDKPENILSVMSELRPEIILMDIYMPDYSGKELAALVRQQGLYLSTPIVFLSRETNVDKQFSAMRNGGDGFLTKPIDDYHLITSVSILAQRYRHLHTLMVKDSLTGLLKHAKIKEQLAIEVERAERTQQPLSFAMLDIDHFKQINDTYGHLVGDRVLKNLARLLAQRLRKSDCVGRYGGDEFAVVLPFCDAEFAGNVLSNVRKSFAELQFTHDGRRFQSTISIGIAELRDYPTTEALNFGADQALYQAKESGRNRIVIGNPRLINGQLHDY